MKKILVILSMALAVMTGCKNNDRKQVSGTNTDIPSVVADSPTASADDTVDTGYTGEQYKVTVSDYDFTAPYICPNHCPGSGSDKPGKCPVCGMELIPNPDYQKQE